MSRTVIFAILCLIFVCAVNCENSSNSTSTALDPVEGRHRRHRWNALWYYYLSHAIAAGIAIKIKIILVLLFVGGSIFYGLKVWQGKALGCPEPVIQEVHHGEHILPYSAHIPAGIISSHPGPEPWGPYGGSGFGASSYGSDAYSTLPEGVPEISNAYLPPSSKRKSYNVKSTGRSSGDSNNGNIYLLKSIEELLFGFLGVDTQVCRKRFVCEMEFRTKRASLVDLAFKYMSGEMFKEYRISNEVEEKRPQKFTDCAKLYSECKAPNEMNIGIQQPIPIRRRPVPTVPTATTTQATPSSNENLVRLLKKRSIQFNMK